MRAVRLEGLRLQVETNATLVDAPIAGILSDIFREDPGTFVSVSLDGGRDVHERRRGVPGCFDAALEGIRRLREGGIRVQVICSLARDNRDEVDVVVRLAERLGAASLKFNFVNDVMRGKRMERWGRRLDVTECLRLERERIAPLGKTAPFPVYTNLPPAFRTIPGIMRGGRCGINGIAGVLFDGSVSFCGIGHFVPELIAGNLREQPFSRIWREGRVFRELRRTVPRRLKGTCGRCMLRGFCLGHCRADAFSKTGRLDTPFSFCEQAEKEGVFPKKWRIPDPAS
jgi:SynChlorMet cassette radical SAM/SPASM protein ScmF